MPRCTICQIEAKKLTPLSIYIIGSEGTDVCDTCRMALTEVARRMRNVAMSARMSVLKSKKK